MSEELPHKVTRSTLTTGIIFYFILSAHDESQLYLGRHPNFTFENGTSTFMETVHVRLPVDTCIVPYNKAFHFIHWFFYYKWLVKS